MAICEEKNDFKEFSDASEIENIKFCIKQANRRRKKKWRSENVPTLIDGNTVSDPERIAESSALHITRTF